MTASSGGLRSDLLAALTVALVGLPQCLAYALMSGLPPAYGLATAAVPGLIAALAGKSPHIITGPTNTTGLLILAALGPFLGDNGLLRPDGLAALATLTLMAGLIRLLAAYAGGAALVEFIPESVLAGFTAGAGTLIAVMQLDESLGMTGVRGGGLLEEFTAIAHHLSQGDVAAPAVLVCALTVAVVLAGKRLRPSFPAALLAVAAAAAAAMIFGLDARVGLPVVSDRAAVPSGWPPGALPSLDPELIRAFVGPAAAIALLGTMELAVSARRGGARPDMRREILAQGLANFIGAFASAFPASASLTRSALLRLGGAASRVAAGVAALILIPILLLGGSLVAALPQASLAGVLLVTAMGMVDLRRLRRMWRASPITRGLLITTFFATLLLPLEWAIFLGVGLGVAQHLAAGRRPRVLLLEPCPDAHACRLVPTRREDAGSVVVIEVSGDCHFAAASTLRELVIAALPERARHVVIDLSHARALRYAALMSLERLDARVRERGGELQLTGVAPTFMRLLESTGSSLRARPFDPEPLASTRRALAELRARAEGDAPASEPREQNTP